MKIFCLFIALFFARVCCAQVEGMVSDANNNEALPFTSVYNQTAKKGVYTDINGFYRIDAQTGDVLQFSYVGYTRLTITAGQSSQILVKLKPDAYELSEIEILPGVNPAHRIIHHAIANRAKNNPDNRKGYSCVLYNKLIAEMSCDPALVKPDVYAAVMKDTGSYLLMNEAVIQRDYQYRNNVSEHVISSRTSGFKDYQQMALFQSTLQFFHFYHDVVEWKAPVKFFLNPVSPGSTSKYFFLLRDTIVSGVDSTFIISYQPRRSANFDGLKGLLYINSNGWAVQSVVAEPADYSPICLKIQQQYALLDSVWFPSELSLELFFNNIYNSGFNAVYRGKSHIADINLSPDLSKKTIKARSITIAGDAHLKPQTIDLYRDTKLTSREDSTFRRYKDGTFDVVFRITEGITDNLALPVKSFDFPFDKITQQNYYEGFRLGLGIYTNRHLSPWFSVGGYYGYGMNDRRSKYGASFSFFPEKHLDSEIRLWWANDLYNLALSKEAGISARKLFGKMNVETFFKVQDFQTVIDYSYQGNVLSHGWERNAEAGFKLRYAQNEERMKMFRRTRTVFTTFPVLYLNFYYGIPDGFGSKYPYLKTEAGVERTWYIRNAGTSTLSIWGGWMNQNTPFPLTFTVTDMQQSLFLSRVPDWRTRFHVLTGNLYAANQYLNVFLYHDFGTLLGKTRSKVFRPRIAVSQSFGLSKLNHRDWHVSEDFDILDMQRGYFESGLVVEDIIRIEIFNLYFLGIGGGIYGAYGESVQKSFGKTLTPKIRVSVSF